MQKIWLIRDPVLAHVYRICVNPKSSLEIQVEVEIVRWRTARNNFSPEAYNDLCRMSFADWCARNL